MTPMLIIGEREHHQTPAMSDARMAQLRREGQLVCHCRQPAIEPLGGAWGLLGAAQCRKCGRPPQSSLTVPT